MTRFEVNFSMVVGEVSPPAAIGMCQYAAPPSAGAQTPRPQRPRLVPPRTTSATSHNAPVGRIANWAINRRARNAPGNAGESPRQRPIKRYERGETHKTNSSQKIVRIL